PLVETPPPWVVAVFPEIVLLRTVEPLANMPPPCAPAVLADTVESSSVSPKALIPPPFESAPGDVELLRTVVRRTVDVPLKCRPPPAKLALLLRIIESVIVVVPSASIPPPSPNCATLKDTVEDVSV